MIKKESRQFYISVEGINCEKMYFEHLAKLINSSDATYNLKSAGTKKPSAGVMSWRIGSTRS